MSLSREAYRALQAVVGEENISEDPAICEADMKGGSGEFIFDTKAVRPACVALPGSTEEVRDVVKIANRYRLPYIPVSTYYIGLCAPSLPDTILLDLKRMDRLEIDERNMFASCEPGVCFSQLQAEAFKRGLQTMTPGCGSQASVVANTAVHGMGPFGYRLGFVYRRILGTEWVLPNGEMLGLGSLAGAQGEYFWGEGPGPDLRGLLRGITGPMGGLGVVTRMAVKLFPFLPELPTPTGISPHTSLSLPTNRMKWYHLTYPTTEKAVSAMYEMARSEIGTMVMTVPPLFRFIARARGKGANAFWEAWSKAKGTIDPRETIVRILLVGYASERQLAYEEAVLKDIAAETGATIAEARPSDESWIMSADAISVYFFGGVYMPAEVSLDSLNQGLKVGQSTAVLKKKRTPPLGEDYGYPGWLQLQELGHASYLEFLAFTGLEGVGELVALAQDCMQRDIDVGAYPVYQDPTVFGPAWQDYHHILAEVKKTFDPNGVSNPPRPMQLFL